VKSTKIQKDYLNIEIETSLLDILKTLKKKKRIIETKAIDLISKYKNIYKTFIEDKRKQES
jgi:phospholipid N-methyltransferase